MILPKGILENTREIYAEVASYNVVPPEKICQYWNVYTTTFRRLVDPTAYRLENFWWHVWGSDLRYMSGPTLAKLFEEFATGPTFVPLRSPASRDEGPSIPRVKRRELDRSDSEPGQPSDSPQQHESEPAKTSVKSPTPSSSRPPPPHPILKKSRGPSSTGPRPTARFVSPPDSGDESGKSTKESTQSLVAVSSDAESAPFGPGSEQENPVFPAGSKLAPMAVTATRAAPAPLAPIAAKQEETISERGLQATATVASEAPTTTMPPPPLPASAAKKKATAEMPPPPLSPAARREKVTSSPAASDTTSIRIENRLPSNKSATPTRKIVASTAASKRRPVMPRRASSQSSAGSDTASREAVAAMAAARQRSMMRSSSQESGASSSSQTSQSSGLTMKALGKRPVRAPTAKRLPSIRNPSGPPACQQEVTVVQKEINQPQRRGTWDGRETVETREPVRSRSRPPPVAGFVVDQAPSLIRTRSIGDAPAVRLPSHALVATTVVATTTTTAQGFFDSDSITPIPLTTISETQDLPSRPSATALLDLQFTPTPPNPAPPIPFGRTMSQLTLLLERDKARDSKGR